MVLKNKRIGVAMTGSFCTYTKAFEQIDCLLEEGSFPVISCALFTNSSPFPNLHLICWDMSEKIVCRIAPSSSKQSICSKAFV